MSEDKTLPPGWSTRAELPYDALIRLDHAEEWVAWDPKMERAVATGLDIEKVHAAAIAAGVDHPIIEWVPPVPIRPVEYAE